MSDDLEWTQALGDALAYQQKDVLVAIQQLRDEAVAKGIIKTDDKIKVVEENDNVVIKSANPEKIYVPQYEPEMLYEPDYASAADHLLSRSLSELLLSDGDLLRRRGDGRGLGRRRRLGRLGRLGRPLGRRRHRHRLQQLLQQRDFNGKVNFNDVDWKNVDREQDQLRPRTSSTRSTGPRSRTGSSATATTPFATAPRDIKKRDQVANRLPGKTAGTSDVRKSKIDGLKSQARQRHGRAKRAGVKNRPAGGPPQSTGRRPAGRARRSTARPASQSRPQGSTTGRRSPPGSATSNRGKRDAGRVQPRRPGHGRRPARRRSSRIRRQSAAVAVAAAAAVDGGGRTRIMTNDQFRKFHAIV